jgi:hypothetical protein
VFDAIFNFRLRGFADDEHVLEQDLERHGMTTALVGKEKLTVALENPIVEFNIMGVVIAIKGKLELFKLKTVSFFSIALGFLNFADHSIVHVLLSPFPKDTKRHAYARVPLSDRTSNSWRVKLA